MSVSIGPLVIGMPQLGPYGLSENWLLRHLGDLHWRMICDALGSRSRDIVDEEGNRLYASFVRVTWIASKPLSAFGESDELTGRMDMVRSGDGIFLSETGVTVGGETIAIKMASIFSRRDREGSNERLLSSAPVIPEGCAIPDIQTTPTYLSDHRLLRTGKMPVLEFAGEKFEVSREPEEVVPYRINGYYDFNGANLLYFASYPTIADSCTATSRLIEKAGGYRRFVTMCSPRARDIFYFGNADVTDSIECSIATQQSAGDQMMLRADLVRASDGLLISRQFVIRETPPR